MDFLDGDGNIVVPRAVRPIIDIGETALGSKKGALRQFRYGNLHILDYDSHYTVHMDKIDPRTNPLGHLLVDAPEYLVGAAAAVIAGRHVGRAVYKRLRMNGKKSKDASFDAIIMGGLAGLAVGKYFLNLSAELKQKT